MRAGHALVAAAFVATALLVQVAVVNRLPLGWGGGPDLALLAVLALALVYGPALGMGAGFGAGLAVDLVPPAHHAIGRYALVFCLVGYLTGRAEGLVEVSVWRSLGAMAAGAAGALALYAGIGWLLSDPRIGWASVSYVMPRAMACDLAVAPLVLAAVARASRRPAAVRYAVARAAP